MIPRFALLLALAPCLAWAQPQGQKKTAWQFGPPVDNGSPRVAAIVEASGRYDNNRPLLAVRCMKGETTTAIIYWPQYLGTGPTMAMKWRTNDSTVKTEDWTLSSDTRSVSHPTPIAFLRDLFGKTELIVSIAPHGGAQATATFPIAGVKDAVKPIIDACNPDPAPEARPRVGEAAPKGQRKSAWGIAINKGSGEVTASVSAIGRFDRARVRPSLAVHCMKGQTEAIVNWAQYLRPEGGAIMAVKWRTDDSTEKTEHWNLRGRFVFHPAPIAFVKSLFGKTELIVSARPAGEPEHSLTFPIAGVEDAMKRISDACQWDPAPGPQPKAGAPK